MPFESDSRKQVKGLVLLQLRLVQLLGNIF